MDSRGRVALKRRKIGEVGDTMHGAVCFGFVDGRCLTEKLSVRPIVARNAVTVDGMTHKVIRAAGDERFYLILNRIDFFYRTLFTHTSVHGKEELRKLRIV